ncbi:MAG: SusC/RagA family TonB-linked outer membrane protein, partial [Prevotella sp.]|nr:SusC/RagA family TonB-linked outer membrane protein [Prevotella sp.]
MRLSCFFLFVCVFQLIADNIDAQNQIELRTNNLSIKELIAEIEKQTDYLFLFRNNDVDINRIIRLSNKREELSSLLDAAFRNTGISYRFQHKYIVLAISQDQTVQENSWEVRAVRQQTGRRITGTITDTKGEPIIGANIIEKGTLNGTVSDLDGNFTLGISTNNAILVITYVGYNQIEVPVGDNNNLSIKMQEDTKILDEIVVVGYGTQKKINLTGSVTSIAFDEEMENRPITNASQALAGKVPGLWVSQNSGQPGNDETQLRVRGWGTLNNTDPLVIIDGVEGQFSQINPNDIESITILKDASSAAIYGSKAANGVILITTKMGTRGEQLQINLSSYVGIQTLDRRYNLVNNSAENMQMINQALINDGSSTLFPDYLISAFRNGADKYKYPNTNWFETFFDNALLHEHNVSIRSGTQKSTSFLSFNYLNQEGIIPNTESYRFSIRANLDYEFNSWLKVGGRINYMSRETEEPYTLTRVYDMLRGTTPYIAPYTREGRFGSVEAIDEEGIMLYDNRNPFIDAANGKRLSTSNHITVNTFADISFMKNLILKTTFST